MIQFLLQHQFWAAVAAYWLFSAAISAMPEPGGNDRPGYLWLYRFLHTTAGNITTVLGSRYLAGVLPDRRPSSYLLLLGGWFDLRCTRRHLRRDCEDAWLASRLVLRR